MAIIQALKAVRVLLNPWVLLTLIAVLAIALIGGYRWGKQAAEDAMLTQYAHDVMLAEQMERIVSESLAKMKVVNTTIRQEVQREVIEKPVYRDCVHDPRGLQLINAAITGLPLGSLELPGADASDGPDFRGDDPEAGRGGSVVPGMPDGGAGVRETVGTEVRY